MSGGVSARLRHQVLEDGRVLVTVLRAGAAALCVRLDGAAAKAFAWGLLADLDPEEAHQAGGPLSVLPPVASASRTPARARPARPASAAALRVLGACPLRADFRVADIVEGLADMRSTDVGQHLRALAKHGLVDGPGDGQGRGRPVRYRLTAAGRTLRSAGAAGLARAARAAP